MLRLPNDSIYYERRHEWRRGMAGGIVDGMAGGMVGGKCDSIMICKMSTDTTSKFT